MASDLGRKVFVGNLSYEYEPRQNPVHHKESDVDTTKGELESKHAMFVSAVRKTAVTSVFSQFGKIECLRSWETNKYVSYVLDFFKLHLTRTPEFFFVVYETNDMAKYTVTTLAEYCVSVFVLLIATIAPQLVVQPALKPVTMSQSKKLSLSGQFPYHHFMFVGQKTTWKHFHLQLPRQHL